VYCEDKYVYVLNVDDLLFADDYEPDQLKGKAYNGGALLLSNPKLDFGKVSTSKTGDILKFEEKPELDILVSVGHYVFKPSKIMNLLSDVGSLEHQTLQYMADKGMLKGLNYNGIWGTVNNYKDLMNVKRLLRSLK